MLWGMLAGKLQLERIIDGLRPRRVGRRIEIHDTVESTNQLGWERVAADPDCDGLVIFTEHQSAGRGRLGHRWESPRGASVLMSLVLVGPAADLGSDILALLTAVAAADAVRSATGVLAEIKWPNDLLVDGRKLGGILIESRLAPSSLWNSGGIVPESVPYPLRGNGRENVPQFDCSQCPREGWGTRATASSAGVYVVGIGINCLQQRKHFPEGLRESATSLELESPRPVERTLVARHLLAELDRWLAEPGAWDAQTLHDAWVRRAQPLGRRVHLRQAGAEFTGQIVDVDPAAGLVVQLDRGGRRLFDAASTSVLD